MDAQENWDDLRHFLAVARHGSLSGAARQLRVNHTTVLRRVTALETAVGVRLFERSPTGYVLTAAGDEMMRAATRVEEDVAEVNRRLSGLDPRTGGVVRVTTVDVLAECLLPRHIAAFQRDHPDIRVEMVVAEASLNLSRRQADVAIRATAHPPEHLVGRRLAGMRFAVYARRGPMPDGEGDAPRSGPWVGLDDGFDHTWMNRWLRANVAPERVVYRVNTVSGLVAAAAAGVGVALLPCVAADQRPELRRIGGPVGDESAGVWVLTHADLRHQYRVRAFIDAVSRAVEGDRAALEGLDPAER